MTELSAGAWRLYCLLARCRNQTTGKCCPSVNLTMESIGINRGTVYKLRNELQSKSWAVFDGNSATGLLGFTSLKNQTPPKSEKSDSPKNQTVAEGNTELRPKPQAIESEKSDSPKSQTADVETPTLIESPKNQTISPESEKSDFLSEKSDSHIGRTSKENQQRIHAAKPGADAPPTANPPDPPNTSAFTIWNLGVGLLKGAGVAENPARSFLGGMRKKYGDEKLAQAIVTAMTTNPINPKEYLVGVLKGAGNGTTGGSNYDQERQRRAKRTLDRLRTDIGAKYGHKRPER